MSAALLVGKLPQAGDFVARGLAPAERSWWDRALAEALEAARASVGDAFAALWDAAPPWRFSIDGPTGALSGTICLSVDAAGRRFPVVAARRGLGWAGRCEDALVGAFSEQQDVDALYRWLQAMPGDANVEEPAGWWLDGGAVAGVGPVAGNDPVPVIAAMLAAGRMLA